MDKKVIVIGGGIAGLAAAAELLRQDCEVKLLEAKPRLGGRIHTISDSLLPIELGAEFMHGQSAALRVAIQAAGLSSHEISLRNDFFEDGKFRRKDILEPNVQNHSPDKPCKPRLFYGKFFTE